MKCIFADKCGLPLEPKTAWVPDLQSLRKAVGRTVEVADLENHAFCEKHARALRHQNIRMYSYVSTAEVLERRRIEREAERAEAGRYNTMYVAFNGPTEKVSKRERKQRKAEALKLVATA